MLEEISLGDYLANVRGLGYIGSSVKGLAAVQHLRYCTDKVKEFLCASKFCREDKKCDVELSIEPLYERDSASTFALTLVRIRGNAVDNLYRFSSSDESLQ